jgi:hypothetical protein
MAYPAFLRPPPYPLPKIEALFSFKLLSDFAEIKIGS